jgi:hypothetical protein
VARWLRPWPWIVAAVAGVVAGAASAWWATGEGAIERVPSSASWATDRLAGAEAADPYTRARIARVGLLALSRGEAVYYLADRDGDDRPLREDCDYLVRGGAMPGRWWSLTVYAHDRFLARNDDSAHSFAAAGDGGGWRVRLAPKPAADAAWLSSRNTLRPSLALRIYRPRPALVRDPMAIDLPRIERLRCEEDVAR